MKKAQIIGQIFIYIMSIVVIGVIVLMGYWAVNNTMIRSCQVEQVTFKTELERAISKGMSYGSVNNEILRAPCGYDTLCFVDSSVAKNYYLTENIAFFCSKKIIVEAIKTSNNTVNDNIFLVNNVKTSAIVASTNIVTTNRLQCTCIPSANGNFHITFKGNGATTTVSQTS